MPKCKEGDHYDSYKNQKFIQAVIGDGLGSFGSQGSFETFSFYLCQLGD